LLAAGPGSAGPALWGATSNAAVGACSSKRPLHAHRAERGSDPSSPLATIVPLPATDSSNLKLVNN
jgi:hypothetical protein